jgi:hypothetical protein
MAVRAMTLLALCLVLPSSPAGAECIDYGIYPRLLGSVQTDFRSDDFAVSGSYIYASAGEDGFRVIDISDPTSPVVVGGLATTSFARNVAADGRYAYLGVLDSGLWIIDVADPAHPVLQSIVPSPDDADDAAVQGNLVYFTDRGNGLYVVDVSDHTAPVVLGHLQFGRDARGIAVQGSYAYVARTEGGNLYMIDVSNPAAPSLVADVDIPGGDPDGIAISGDHAYLAAGSAGLVVLDISNPVAVTESFVYQIDQNRVVVLPLQCEPAAAPEVASSFARPMLVASPQPSRGDVSLRFDLPRAGAVTLGVVDAAGRRIRSLREGNAGTGPNELRWDGRDDAGRRVESGIYFIRMQWEGGRETARAVVLR